MWYLHREIMAFVSVVYISSRCIKCVSNSQQFAKRRRNLGAVSGYDGSECDVPRESAE